MRLSQVLVDSLIAELAAAKEENVNSEEGSAMIFSKFQFNS
jgi:hypothetical protein